jgi:hypothetical protein
MINQVITANRTWVSVMQSSYRCVTAVPDETGHDGVGIDPLSLHDPIVATYPIHRYCNTLGGGMLALKKFCA